MDMEYLEEERLQDWVDSQDEPVEVEECSLCGGPLMELGQLGRLMHYRCRNCGMQSSKESD